MFRGRALDTVTWKRIDTQMRWTPLEDTMIHFYADVNGWTCHVWQSDSCTWFWTAERGNLWKQDTAGSCDEAKQMCKAATKNNKVRRGRDEDFMEDF